MRAYLLPAGLGARQWPYPLAKAAANRALQLDPSLGEAHTSLAFTTFIFDRDWTAADAAFKRALQYNPGYATAHHWFAEYLSALGRLDESLAEFERAKSLDPLSAPIKTASGSTLYAAQRYDSAIAELRASLDLDASSPMTYLFLGGSYEQKGMLAEATAETRRGLQFEPQNPSLLAAMGPLGGACRAVEPRRSRWPPSWTPLRSSRACPPRTSQSIYAAPGDKDRAFAMLRRAEQDRSPGLLWLRSDPIFDPLRSDARFAQLVQRLGFPQ